MRQFAALGAMIAPIKVLHNNCVCAFGRVRELTAAKIGTLLRITGQVVRTHPVHPELISGTFLCLDCRTLIKDVEQQFKYTQVGVRGGEEGVLCVGVYSGQGKLEKSEMF